MHNMLRTLGKVLIRLADSGDGGKTFIAPTKYKRRVVVISNHAAWQGLRAAALPEHDYTPVA